ncbi:hypothetical protein Clacol_000266 [Clathrus columnatus]|uniref:Uncharacterized protein n=1 Tax=Clathrus columnatus TaxID=1419009 RepID=A0AAV4ZWE9_9AGAM|nr:hypothetical protein Clacol_000266 [Clathrus columnatus]
MAVGKSEMTTQTATTGLEDGVAKEQRGNIYEDRIHKNKPSSKSSTTATNGKAKQERSMTPLKPSRSDREAYACAVSIRTLILPTSQQTSGSPNSRVSRSVSLIKIQNQLLDPTSGAAVISHLRRLPRPSETSVPTIETIHTSPICGPSKAIALSVTDEEANKLFSSQLRLSPKSRLAVDEHQHIIVSIHNASLSSIVDAMKNLQVISFLGGGTLGLGDSVESQPSAILSGSLPSAPTFLAGLNEISKALLDFGYATDELPFPDHKNVHPPTDRLSIMKVDSVATTLIHLLTIVSIVSPELKEFMPIIGYVSNIINSEWDLVKAQDKGEGVVCTATWIMPIALIPRPWDFPPAPPEISKPTEASLTSEVPVPEAPTTIQSAHDS